jgi:tripartite-type tricarboxylate transporter receptor subunit TctC
MNADAVAAIRDPVIKSRFDQLGVAAIASTPAELTAFLQSEMDKWGPVIKDAGITGTE